MTTLDASTAPPRHPLTPVPYRVAWRRVDAADTVTLALDPVEEALPSGLPGQFNMLYAFGVGEIPISYSGCPEATDTGSSGRIEHTVRAVGAVSEALAAAMPGDVIGVRGPFGTTFDLKADGGDLVIVAGGLGMAPLRPAVLAALANQGRYRRILLAVGARTPDQLIYPDQLNHWARSGAEVAVTVDSAPRGWTGHVGVVTALLGTLPIDPTATNVVICGPEPMMRFTAKHLIHRGVAEDRIQVSLERTMHCAFGLCGRCQLGPLLVCRDGAVVRYPDVVEHWAVRER